MVLIVVNLLPLLYVKYLLLNSFNFHLCCLLLYYANLFHRSMSCSNIKRTPPSDIFWFASWDISRIIGPILLSVTLRTWYPMLDFPPGIYNMSKAHSHVFTANNHSRGCKGYLIIQFVTWQVLVCPIFGDSSIFIGIVCRYLSFSSSIVVLHLFSFTFLPVVII